MAGSDRRIDSMTRDYLPDGQGGVEQTRTAISAVYHAAATRLGSVVAAPARGSRLAEVVKATPTAGTLSEQITALALEPLETAGMIADIEVAAAVAGSTLQLTATCTDSSGEPLEVVV